MFHSATTRSVPGDVNVSVNNELYIAQDRVHFHCAKYSKMSQKLALRIFFRNDVTETVR